MLEISGVSKYFEGIFAVNNVTFSISKGSITGLIGPNGAGKTTLFNLISGFLKPEKGVINFQGSSITGSKPHQIATAGIGRTFQNLRIIKALSAIENVLLAFSDGGVVRSILKAFGNTRQTHRLEKAEQLLGFVGLADKSCEAAGTLSYGQQKLLSFACCLALDPKLLLLDEPVAGVNQEMIVRIQGLLIELKKRGIAVFLIEHNIEAVMEVVDRIIVMDEGRIIADGLPAVIEENPAVIEAYLE